MSYIEKSLGHDEKLIARAHFHWWYSVKAWLALIFLFWLLGWGIFVFVAMMLRKRNTEIGVTTHRFIMKTGIFSLHTQEMAIHNIEGVKVDQGFWGRMFNFGHLRIEGTGVDAIQLPVIADPVAFRAAIETAKDRLAK